MTQLQNPSEFQTNLHNHTFLRTFDMMNAPDYAIIYELTRRGYIINSNQT